MNKGIDLEYDEVDPLDIEFEDNPDVDVDAIIDGIEEIFDRAEDEGFEVTVNGLELGPQQMEFVFTVLKIARKACLSEQYSRNDWFGM